MNLNTFEHLNLEHESQSYYVVVSVLSERDGCISVNHVLQRLTGPVISISPLITVINYINHIICTVPESGSMTSLLHTGGRPNYSSFLAAAYHHQPIS